MDKHEPSTIKHRRYWSGIKAADGIMAAFSKRNAQLLQPHNPRERICGSAPKLGFTLAEVLITLSIIGVVAALTIPTLIQRTGDEEIISKLNKAYSTLSQATEIIITENGSPQGWLINNETFFNAYKNRLRNSKECGTAEGCFAASYKYLDGTGNLNYSIDKNHRRLVLADGMPVLFNQMGNINCNPETGHCADIWVDVNGLKGPNVIGRDLFIFDVKTTGLYPAGCSDDSADCNSSGKGLSCACKVIQEGKIDY